MPAVNVVAVVGATGLLGEELLTVMSEREFPAATMRALAGLASAGERVAFGHQELRVEVADEDALGDADLVFLAAGDESSAALAAVGVRAGAVVLDMSAGAVADPSVPLVVPQVNPRIVIDAGRGQHIAVGTGALAGLAATLKPLGEAAGLHTVTVATYEPVAALGRRAVVALGEETVRLLNGLLTEEDALARRAAFNCIPALGALDEEGHTQAEALIVGGLQRLLERPELMVAATTVQVPTFHGLGVAVTVETAEALGAAAARGVLRAAPGLLVAEAGDLVTTRDAVGSDAVHVARVRDLPGAVPLLGFWLALDPVRLAALNAVSFAQSLMMPG